MDSDRPTDSARAEIGDSAREREEYLLDVCQAAAEGRLVAARDEQEASVLELASQLLPASMALQARRLHAAAGAAPHNGAAVPATEAVRRGWVQSLPRLKQSLLDRLGDRRP